MFVCSPYKHVIFKDWDFKCFELRAQVKLETTRKVNHENKNAENFVKTIFKTSKPDFTSVINYSVSLWKLHFSLPTNLSKQVSSACK